MTIEELSPAWWEVAEKSGNWKTWQMIAHYCSGASMVDDDHCDDWYLLNVLAWERATGIIEKAA
jgi:hypothetical protein